MPKCKSCKETYERKQSGQVVCSFQCGIEYAKANREKKEKEKKKQINKEKKAFYANDEKSLKLKAQDMFNKYIRTRDKGNVCISCDAVPDKGHASHFYSVGGHSAVRFNTDNVHLSCIKCNLHLHGNLVPYKVKLIEKIGLERFNNLTEKSRDIKLYSKDYYKKIIRVFNKKTKKL